MVFQSLQRWHNGTTSYKKSRLKDYIDLFLTQKHKKRKILPICFDDHLPIVKTIFMKEQKRVLKFINKKRHYQQAKFTEHMITKFTILKKYNYE